MLSLEDAARIGYKFEELWKGHVHSRYGYFQLETLYLSLVNQREETDTKGA